VASGVRLGGKDLYPASKGDFVMRVLIVDDSPPRRHLLSTVLRAAGHEPLTASNGVVALDILEGEPVDAVVSDVKMPRMDGFALCRAIRRNARIRHVPFIFYSSIFTGGAAHELGMDLGATAYLDAKRILPDKVAREIEQLVSRLVNVEYRQALVRLHDDLEFARRDHAVVLSTDTTGESGIDALDHLLSRLDSERATLASQQDVVVPVTELNRLRELSDQLREAMNRPLGAGGDGPPGAATEAPLTASDNAAASMRLTVRHINELVRKLSARKHVMEPDR
jgi:CheY-like chemotaxis protein